MKQIICIAFTSFVFSSCITSKGILKSGGEKKSGTVGERTEIVDNPETKSLHLTFGRAKNIGFGADAAKMMPDNSKLTGSVFLLAKRRSIFDDEQQSTPNNLLLRHFMSLSYSYPIISNSSYRSGKMYLRESFNSSAEAKNWDGSTYVLKDKFKVLHFINLVGGIAHGYTTFRSEAFNSILFGSHPNSNASVLGAFNDVQIHTGSYYGKIGISSTQLINTYLKGSVDGNNISGNISRELKFSLSALIGVFGTIPTTNVEYRYFEDGNFIYAEEEVDFKKLLNYERLGFEAGFHWMEYLTANLSLKYSISLGLIPGYIPQDDLLSSGFFKVAIGFGIGSISE